jgi:nitrogen fixation protein FixH
VKVFIAVVLAAGLGTVVATIWIGSGVREEQVVDQPYETGLRYDADRAARSALGWTARVEEAGLAPRPSVVRLTLWDGAGAPLDGAQVTVAATRPETSRDRVTARARPLGTGRYEAELAFAGAGRWEVALDVRRGADRLVLERSVTVSSLPPSPQPSPPAVESSAAHRLRGERGNSDDGGPNVNTSVPLSPRAPGAASAMRAGGEGRGEVGDAPSCDLAAGRCTRALPDGSTVTLDLGPRPLKPFTDLAAIADLRDPAGRPLEVAEVAVSFAMPGMSMGENRAVLAPVGRGRYAGKAVLVRCPSGGRDWRAEVTVRAVGMAPASATFELRVAE